MGINIDTKQIPRSDPSSPPSNSKLQHDLGASKPAYCPKPALRCSNNTNVRQNNGGRSPPSIEHPTVVQTGVAELAWREGEPAGDGYAVKSEYRKGGG